MKKRPRMMLALLITLLLALSAGGGAFAESSGGKALPYDQPWFSPYDEPVPVRITIPTNIAMVFPEGESYSNNVWTRELLAQMNIKVETMWEAVGGEQYETKLNLSIASNDLPDIITLSSFSQFEKLQKAGKLEDLTAYYDEYAYPYFRRNIEMDGGEVLSWGTVDGKLMGIPQGNVNYQQTRMVWIRADWLEASGLPEPKTMEDVIAIAKAFKDADPANRHGLPFFKTVLEDGMCDMTGIANAYGAFPRVWLEDGEGGLKYGSIQPEMKTALGVYADLYAGGYIDPAFASLDGGKVGEQIASNQIGVIVGNFWLSGWPLAGLWDTDHADWNIYPLLPSETLEQPLKTQTFEPDGKLVVVRKGFEHPEILFKWLNFTVAKTADADYAEPEKYHSTPAEVEPGYGWHMMNPLYVYWNDPMLNFDSQPHVTAAIDTGDTSHLTTPHDWTQYENTIRYFDQQAAGGPITGEAWSAYKSWYGEGSTFGILNSYFANDSFMVSKLTGYQTDTMVKQWSNLKTLEEQYIVEIISGARPLDGFEEFCQTWLAMGGEKITQEVSEWYKNK